MDVPGRPRKIGVIRRYIKPQARVENEAIVENPNAGTDGRASVPTGRGPTDNPMAVMHRELQIWKEKWCSGKPFDFHQLKRLWCEAKE